MTLKPLLPPVTPSRLHGQLETFARELHSLRQRLVELDAKADDHLPRLFAPPLVLRPAGTPSPAPAAGGALPDPVWWPKAFGASPPFRPNPGFRSASLVDPNLPAIAVSCCGLSVAETLACIDATVADQSRHRGYVAMYLTDAAEQLHLFRHQGLDVELLPEPGELVQQPGSLSAEDFLARRLRDIRQTWGLTGFRDGGKRPLPWPPAPATSAAPYRARPRLFFWKDYRRHNPYQHLLYLAMPGISAHAGDLATAIAALDQGPVFFHLNWEEALYRAAEDAASAEAMVLETLAALDLFTARGGRLIWTLHNAVPHENRFPEVQDRLARGLATRAALCIVHSAEAGRIAQGHGLPEERLVEVPHGGYHSLYAATTPRAQARKALKLPGDGLLFGFVGAVRPYKNVGLLLEAFDLLAPGTARLLIAGEQRPVLDIAARPDVILRNEVIPEAELSDTLRACDAIVLPFEQVLTSGSMMLALSHGVPVIVPEHPSLCETVFAGVNGLTFAPGAAESLAATLAAFAALPEADRAAMGRQALTSARMADWGWIGRKLQARIEAL